MKPTAMIQAWLKDSTTKEELAGCFMNRCWVDGSLIEENPTCTCPMHLAKQAEKDRAGKVRAEEELAALKPAHEELKAWAAGYLADYTEARKRLAIEQAKYETLSKGYDVVEAENASLKALNADLKQELNDLKRV